MLVEEGLEFGFGDTGRADTELIEGPELRGDLVDVVAKVDDVVDDLAAGVAEGVNRTRAVGDGDLGVLPCNASMRRLSSSARRATFEERYNWGRARPMNALSGDS